MGFKITGRPLGFHGDLMRAERARLRPAFGLKTAGQKAYEADCLARPFYDDGTRRKGWRDLGEVERDSWERNPTPRWKLPPV
jgi:hypothetical protein